MEGLGGKWVGDDGEISMLNEPVNLSEFTAFKMLLRNFALLP